MGRLRTIVASAAALAFAVLSLGAAPSASADDDPAALVRVVADRQARAEDRIAAAKHLEEMGERAASAAEAMGDALIGGERGWGWNHVPEKEQGPALLAPLLARLGDAGRTQLRRALRTQNPAAIVLAARALTPLGAKAAPAVPDLVTALAYVPPDRLMQLHWHPWQPYASAVPRTVLEALAAIGPLAKDALPVLRARFAAAQGADPWDRGERAEVLLALAAIAPEDPVPLADVLDAIDAGRLRLLNEHVAPLDPWIAKLGTDAIPLLTRIEDAESSPEALDRLAAMGPPAHATLVGWLRDPRMERGRWTSVEAMTRRRCFPEEAVPVVAEMYRGMLENGGEKTCAPWLAGAGDAGEAAAFDVLCRKEWSSRYWALLREAHAEFAERLSRRWWESRRPKQSPWIAAEGGPARTALVGGKGGEAFTAPAEGGLVGIEVGLGGQHGRTIVRSVAPLSRRDGVVSATSRQGARDLETRRLIAREGYAVGGVLVSAADARVTGLAVVFLRVREGALDPADGYVSPWIGRAGEGRLVVLGGDGRRVAGLTGRAGADVDALGLVASE